VPCLEESLPLWPPEDVLPLASTYLNLGLALAGQGELDRALSMYRHSLSLQEASGNGRADPRTLVNMGTLYYDLGNYRAALDCYLRSQGLPGPDDPARTAKMFINIGNIHSRQGDQKQALDHYRRALEILQPLAPHPAIAIAENNIGSAYEQLGDYRLALEHFQKSLALRNPQEPEGIASVRGNIAATYLALGNPGEAETNWLESLRLYEQMGFMVGIARIHGELAYFRFKTGRLDEALAEAEKAIAIARPRGLADLLSRALTTAGSVHLAMGQSREARRDFDEAIQVIETMRSRLAGGEESKESFLEDRLSPYQEVVSLLVQQNRAAEALSYAERAKARVLGDILREGRDRSERFMTPVEREEQERLATELASLNTRLAQAGADSAVLAELQDRQREARLRLEEFQFRLGAAHPELAAARGEAALLGPDQLLALVPDDQTALLDYLALPDRTYLFVLTRDPGRRPRPHISVYTLDLTKSNALERIRDFRERILDSDPAVGRSAQSLYDLLIRPAEEHLQQRNRLVVSPDGILWDLPFAALQSTFNRSLMEEYAITFTPSLSVWQSMRYRAASFTGQTGAVSLLAFGNPRLPQGGEAGTFAPLPEAEKEVKALVPIYEPDETRVYTGSDADEARFKAQAPHARILHLATHGVLDGASPLYSYLALAPDGSEEDGFLEARELLEMDLHADVAVLSACETARGRIGAGEGVIGLSWALFAAGCTTTVVSLWPVESAATTEMMVAFHRGLRGSGPGGRPPLPPAEALRQAALSLRRQPSTRHPFYWAGFLVMGRGF
jgi:CHAT domain-containing protein